MGTALICPDCGWCPPPGYRYGSDGHAKPNKAKWAAFYQEHRRLRLCPQFRAEQNQKYIRGHPAVCMCKECVR